MVCCHSACPLVLAAIVGIEIVKSLCRTYYLNCLFFSIPKKQQQKRRLHLENLHYATWGF